MPWIRGTANPSSSHWAGVPARKMVEDARTQVADLIGCAPREIVFTSGGSEANNHALKGLFFASGKERPHFITSSIEYRASGRCGAASLGTRFAAPIIAGFLKRPHDLCTSHGRKTCVHYCKPRSAACFWDYSTAPPWRLRKSSISRWPARRLLARWRHRTASKSLPWS